MAVLVKLPNVRLSLPEPRLMLALLAAVPSVTTSAPVPPIRVSMLLTVPVLAGVRQGQRAGAAAEVHLHAGGQRGGQGDGVGACTAGDGFGVADGERVAEVAERQGIVAGAEVDAGVVGCGAKRDGVGAGAADDGRDTGAVRVLVPLASVSVSAPEPRTTLALATAAPNVIASVPMPPINVSTLLTVPVLAALFSVKVLLPAPRSTDIAVVSPVPSVMLSSAVPADDGLDVRHRRDVGEIAEGQNVVAGAQVDAGIARRDTQRDDVGGGAAKQRGDIANRAGVGDVGQRQRAFAGAEIDRHGGGQRGGQGDVIVADAAGDRLGGADA